MEQNRLPKLRKCFAAANTYQGFKSYFDEYFTSKEYQKIYVLKGGPGTGKSSFMKRVSALFQTKGCDVCEIYCSSDPKSLDGVIVENENKKIAILDGTAPHERDAVIPGAIDELINLGKGWDNKWLIAQRDRIIGLNDEKKKSYKTAYSYLGIAGKASEMITSPLITQFDKTKVKYWAESFFKESYRNNTVSEKSVLLSSFGRFGEYRLPNEYEIGAKVIGIKGDRFSVGVLLRLVTDLLKQQSIRFTHFPNVLSPELTDAIYLPHQSILITYKDDGSISASDFFRIGDVDRERIKKAIFLHDEALDEARRHFAIASNLHFELEEIYSYAMDFDYVNQIITENIGEIANILEISL